MKWSCDQFLDENRGTVAAPVWEGRSVHIHSDRSYRFDGDRWALWRAIGAVEHYPRWWPWLRDFDGRLLHAGEVWSCTVHPPLPYVLRFRIHLDEVAPARHISSSIDGDIIGAARLELRDHTDGCEVRLISDLAPHNRFLRRVASVARPVVRFGHDWVLDTGARQFTDRFAPRPGHGEDDGDGEGEGDDRADDLADRG